MDNIKKSFVKKCILENRNVLRLLLTVRNKNYRVIADKFWRKNKQVKEISKEVSLSTQRVYKIIDKVVSIAESAGLIDN